MSKPIAEIRMLGGHPVLDFVNTVESRRDRWGPDYLGDFQDLISWAVRTELVNESVSHQLAAQAKEDPEAARRAFAKALELREALYALFMVEAADAPFPDRKLAMLNDYVRAGNSERRLERSEGPLMWSEPGSGLDLITSRLALSGAELLAGRPGRRSVRECTGPNCGWLFLDRSRGGQRRWCSDRTCGTVTRVRRFRAEGI